MEKPSILRPFLASLLALGNAFPVHAAVVAGTAGTAAGPSGGQAGAGLSAAPATILSGGRLSQAGLSAFVSALPAAGSPSVAARRAAALQISALNRAVQTPGSSLSRGPAKGAADRALSRGSAASGRRRGAAVSWLTRQLILHPAALGDPVLRARVSASLGAKTLRGIEKAASRVARAEKRTPGIRAALLEQHRTISESQAVSLDAILKGLSAHGKAFGSLDGGAATLPASGKSGIAPADSRLKPAASVRAAARSDSSIELSGLRAKNPAPRVKPSRPSLWRRVVQAAVLLFMGASTLATALPAVAQTADRAPLPMGPVPVLVAQANPGLAVRQADFVKAANIKEVIARWTPGTHLYVIGDVGLSNAQLRKLAGSLEGTHWTVVLVDDANGNRFTNFEGRSFTGVDAVDFGTGQGIGKKDGFSEQVHPRTGESDGKIFTIVMAQRALFYFGSQAQDLRGLGDKNFKGDLDQWAISSLRNGGDVEGAVKNTVKNIDARLASALDRDFTKARSDIDAAKSSLAELARSSAKFAREHPERARTIGTVDEAALSAEIAKAEAALKANRPAEAIRLVAPVLSRTGAVSGAIVNFVKSHADAGEAIASAEAEIGRLESEAAAFRENFPKATGDLARPDVRGMRESLGAARKTLESSPADAAAAASAVRGTAQAALSAIAEFSSGADALAGAAARLAELERHDYKDAARSDIVAAKQRLGSAQELYAQGSSAFSAELQAAKSLLTSAEISASDAQAAAARNKMILIILLLVGTLGTAGLGLWANRRLRGLKKETEQLYADWDAALDRKLDTMVGELEDRVLRWIGPVRTETLEGKTKRLAVETRANVGSLNIIWTSANDVLDRAGTLVHPKSLWTKIYNLFFTKNFLKAKSLLADEPVRFKPLDGIERLFKGAKARDWKEELLGDLQTYKPFEKSFNELIAEFNRRAAAAAEALSLIENSTNRAEPAMKAVAAAIASAEKSIAAFSEAGKDDGLFLLPSLAASFVPAAKAALEKTRAVVKNDPVGGLEGVGAEAERLSKNAGNLAAVAAAARAEGGAVPAAEAAKAALAGNGIATAWIDDELTALSGKGEALAASLKTTGGDIGGYGASLDGFAGKAGRAAELNAALKKARAEKIAAVGESVRAARSELGAALELSPERMLRENGANPSERLDGAAEQAGLMSAALGLGDIEAAEVAFAELNRLSSEASAIVSASRSALAAQQKTVAERRAETARVEDLVPEHERLLARIKKDFAESVMALQAGDPSHPNGNGTVADNLREANENLAAAHEKLQDSIAAHREGRLLEAADLLAQIAAHQEFVLHRLGEIAEKDARLTRTVASNGTLLGELEDRVRTFGLEVADDRRTMEPTLAEFAAAKKLVAAASKAVLAAKGDPFKAEASLLAAKKALEDVWVHTRNDRDLYAEAERSLAAAKNALESAEARSREAENDGIVDSSEIDRTQALIRKLASEYDAAAAAIGAAHGDWNALDDEADRITREGARAAATLQGEMQRAEQAVSAIESARFKVHEAASWSGSYGVYISGSPGSGELNSARASLSRGDYDEAISYAEAARRRAASAIAEAESEEARRRRAEQERIRREREARERREREERERRNRSVGGGGGGGSSWGGSSSGNGRSGW